MLVLLSMKCVLAQAFACLSLLLCSLKSEKVPCPANTSSPLAYTIVPTIEARTNQQTLLPTAPKLFPIRKQKRPLGRVSE